MKFGFDELYQAALLYLSPEEAGPLAYALTGEYIESEEELKVRVRQQLPKHDDATIDNIVTQIIGGEE